MVALIPTLIVLSLIGTLLFFMNRGLVRRKGRLAGFVNFSFALVGFGMLASVQSFLPALARPDDDNFSLAEAYPLFAFIVGMTVMLVFLAFRYKDVRRWFPAKVQKQKN